MIEHMHLLMKLCENSIRRFLMIAALVVMLEEITGLSQDEIMQHIRKNQVARMGMN